MENAKACLPDMFQNRIEDLVNVQTTDEEMTAHMKELTCRVRELEALAGGSEDDQVRQLGEDIQRLCDRIRRDYVAMAYHQGFVDGARFKQIVDAPEA